MERGCTRHPHPAEPQLLDLPPSGFAHSMVASQGWWDTTPVGAGRTGIWSHEPHTRPQATGHGERTRLHWLGTSTPQIPAPATPLQLCSVPWGGRAHGGSEGGSVTAAHPQQALQPAAAATLLFCPETAQTTGTVVVGAAGRSWHCHQRPPEPPVPGWDRYPVLSHEPGTDAHRCCGPSLGHRAPRGCSWRTHGSSTWSIPVPVPWQRCPAPELHHGLPCVLESST